MNTRCLTCQSGYALNKTASSKSDLIQINNAFSVFFPNAPYAQTILLAKYALADTMPKMALASLAACLARLVPHLLHVLRAILLTICIFILPILVFPVTTQVWEYGDAQHVLTSLVSLA
jgi:hypothetical protein